MKAGGGMSYQDDFDNVAQEVLAKVANGATLNYRLCQTVIAERGSTARPGAILFTTAGLLSQRAHAARFAAG